MKKTIITVIITVAVMIGIYFVWHSMKKKETVAVPAPAPETPKA